MIGIGESGNPGTLLLNIHECIFVYVKKTGELYRLLGDEVRLRLLRVLAGRHGRLNVTELTAVLGIAQPGVSRHLRLLKEAGLVEIWKGFEGRRPQTLVRLTRSGRQRFLEYLEELERLLEDAQRAKEAPRARPPRLAIDPV